MGTRTVDFAFKQLDQAGVEQPAGGTLRIELYPVVDRPKTAYTLIPASITPPLTAGAVSLPLEDSDTFTTGCYKVTSPSTQVRYITVPAGSGSIAYEACVDVNPDTFAATAEPSAAWYAALSALQAEVDALDPGGSGLPAGGVAGDLLVKQSATDGDAAFTAGTKALIGLGNVDNTSDADKPVSTAQAAAIAAKADPADITAAIDSLISGAPGALDTLNELAAALGDDAAFSATVTAALAARVRVDTAAQGLTGTQQSNARANIGAGTSSLAVGTGAADAKAGNWTPGLADLPASTAIATASGTRPSSRTDLICLFTNTTPDGSQLTNDVWLKP